MVEAILAPRRALALNAASRTLVTLPVDLDPQAASITVRIPRPTSANPLAWGATGRIRVRLCVEHDGVLHTCEGGTRGGVMRDNRPGRGGAEIPEYSLTWNLPTGFFAQGNEPKEMWPAIANRRWGETAKASYRAWVEVERLAGSIAAEVEVRAAIEPAPPLEYHSSVAYQNSSSVVEDIGGDMATSLSYDAGAGSDRAALIWASACRDSAPTSISLTFNSSTPSTSAWEVAETNTRQKAMVVLDSEIGSGAKTVACAGSGGSGSIYGTHLHIASFTGVHQTTPLGTAQTTSGATGTSISVTVASPATDSVVVDGLWAATQGGTAPTIGASQTQRQGTSANGSIEAGRTSTQAGADGGVMSWTKGSSNWNYVYGAIELKAAGGTAYTQTLTGGVTPAGALVKRDNKLASGAVTPAGALRKQASKLAAGVVTPAGALRKTAAKLVSGAVTPAGALVRQAGKVLSGAAASSGALVRSVAQLVGGAVAPAGGLSKSVSKPLAGSAAPAGALANVRAVLLTLSGGITPAGALTRQAAKVVSGTVTSAGALTRAVSLVRAGVVAPAGAVAKSVSKLLSGTIASIVGALSNVLSGAVSVRGQVVVRDEPTATASLDDAAVWEATVSDELAFGAEVRDE